MRKIRRKGLTAIIVCLVLVIGGSFWLHHRATSEEVEDRKREIFHPRNIIPILMKNYDQIKMEIQTLNQTLQDMSEKFANSDFSTKSSSKLEGAKSKGLSKSKEIEARQKMLKSNGQDKSKEKEKIKWDISTDSVPSYNVHAFYYPWYGNPDHDQDYFHWNHQFIQHWKEEEAKKWPSGRHKPPDDIGANFYPSLGAYSSSDKDVIDIHMKMMKFARIGVVVVSWYPPGDADAEGNQPDSLMPAILDSAQKYGLKRVKKCHCVIKTFPDETILDSVQLEAQKGCCGRPSTGRYSSCNNMTEPVFLLDSARKYGLKVALHVEPYRDRNHVTWQDNLKYIMKQYGNHSAFYRTNFNGKKNLPLFYIYDSYTVPSHLWAEVFTSGGNFSVRNTELDGIFIGLLVEQKHQLDLKHSGFDGIYTYFATNGFTYGSSWVNWKTIAKFCVTNRMMFIPSIGPGYIDTEIRPWNGANKRKRLDGKYYNESFTSAWKVSPYIISITSFNEWHEGTQIEPAVKKDVPGRTYLNYREKGENFYLNLTRQFVDKFEPLSVTQR